MSDARLWPAGCALAAACAAAAVLGSAPPALRALFVLPFLLVCPGTAIVRLLRLREPAAEIALGLAASVAISGGVPAILLYAHAWSPRHAFGIIVALTLGAALADAVRPAEGR